MSKKLRITDRAKAAGGVPAILHSMRTTFSQMGPWRATKTLLKLNQKGGFDCPGCAWPDPDDRSVLGEFCENGAKAVAHEAMRRTIGAEFFQRHSIEELSARSEYWLGQQGRIGLPVCRRSGASHYEPI